MQDGPFFQGLFLYVDPYGNGTKRFSASLDSVPAWWNTNYTAPDSARRLYTHELIALIKEIPHIGKVNFYYLESNEIPTTPYWMLAMDPSFPSPGTNGTAYNEQGEIMSCTARGPPSIFGKKELYIESLQAIAKLYDSGGRDPRILGPNEDNTILIINELGKKLLSFIYFVHPNTRI